MKITYIYQEKWFSDFNMHQNHLELCLNTDRWSPIPEFVVQQVWDGARLGTNKCSGDTDCNGPGTTTLWELPTMSIIARYPTYSAQLKTLT